MSCKNNINQNLFDFNKNKQSVTFYINSSCKWYDTGLELKIGKKYIFTVSKDVFWNDSDIKTNACGYKPSELKWYNPSRYALGLADLFNAKRFPEANWFEIIGCICDISNNCSKGDCFRMFNCNNPKYDENGNITNTFTVLKKGKLFCYANDNNYFYWNNNGSITITIKEEE